MAFACGKKQLLSSSIYLRGFFSPLPQSIYNNSTISTASAQPDAPCLSSEMLKRQKGGHRFSSCMIAEEVETVLN